MTRRRQVFLPRIGPRPCLRGRALAQLQRRLAVEFLFRYQSPASTSHRRGINWRVHFIFRAPQLLLSHCNNLRPPLVYVVKLRSHAPPGHLSPHCDSPAAHRGPGFYRNVSRPACDGLNNKGTRQRCRLHNMASNAQATGADPRAEEMRRRNVAGLPAATPQVAQAPSTEKSKEKVGASGLRL